MGRGAPEGHIGFLSTPSARRATIVAPHCLQRHIISIHALREEGDCQFYSQLFFGKPISIHALREEGDSWVRCWRGILIISIHALREEGDVSGSYEMAQATDFYPRPPRGGRRQRHKAYQGT